MRVLVTGANGFVGAHILQYLCDNGVDAVGLVRRPMDAAASVNFVVDETLSDFSDLLTDFDAVVHTAGVAHRTGASEEETRKAMIEGNTDLTSRIAAAVRDSNAKVLIHISSIAAIDSGKNGQRAAYGESKSLAEKPVEELREHDKLGVNLRPPLIYGAGAKGNWSKLVQLAKSSAPLPFASVRNHRSFLGISNLCGLVMAILEKADQPELSGTYAVADNELVSLPEIVRALRNDLGRGGRVFPFPVPVMDRILRLAGKGTMADGLFQDLRIDSSGAKRRFDWSPAKTTLPSMVESLSSRPPIWI